MNRSENRQEQATTTVKLNISAAAMRNGTFNAVCASYGLNPRPVVDGRQQAIGQFQNYGIANGGYAPGSAQMPLSNSGTALGSLALQQIEPQSAPAAGQRQGGVAPKIAPAAPAPAANSQQLQANSAPRGAAAATANNFNGPSNNVSGPAVQPKQANTVDQNAAQTNITLNTNGSFSGINGAFNYGAVPSYNFECDATPAQLAGVLKQLGEQRDDFSRPEVVSSAPVGRAQATRRALDDQKTGNDQYNFGVAKGSAAPAKQAPAEQAPAKQAKDAKPGEAESDTDKLEAAKPEDLPRQRVAGKALGGARVGGPQARAFAQSRSVAEKTRVLFLLNVVDSVAPLPAAAAKPAPANGK
jgi:hypothetical protein